MNIQAHVGHTVQVKLPENKPLFGKRDELHSVVGICVKFNEIDLRTIQFFWDPELNAHSIKEGLEIFTFHNPGTKVTFIAPKSLPSAAA